MEVEEVMYVVKNLVEHVKKKVCHEEVEESSTL